MQRHKYNYEHKYMLSGSSGEYTAARMPKGVADLGQTTRSAGYSAGTPTSPQGSTSETKIGIAREHWTTKTTDTKTCWKAKTGIGSESRLGRRQEQTYAKPNKAKTT